jgi:hypothetical protein
VIALDRLKAFQGRMHEEPALRPTVLAPFAAENVAQLAAAPGGEFSVDELLRRSG